MKPIKAKICRECGKDFMPTYNSTQVVCSMACAAKRSKLKEQEKKAKQMRKEKSEGLEGLRTVPDWLNVAQRVVNSYVRLRDADLPCISCHATKAKWSAGHFHSMGNHSFLRFHEDNLHRQCYRCNFELHSNPHEYRERLTLKIGAGRVEYLDKHRNLKSDYSIDVAKELIAEYKMKIKQLKTKI